MRTTLDLPEGLVERAKRLGRLPSKRAAVVTALEDYVRAREREALVAMLGKTDIDLTQAKLEAMRLGDGPTEPTEGLRMTVPDTYPPLDTE